MDYSEPALFDVLSALLHPAKSRMPYTVPVAFDNFIESISVTNVQHEASETRRLDIIRLLEKHFDVLESFATGSLSKGTGIRGYADLDIMVALHYGKHTKDRTPEAVLQEVRDVLAEYKTNVRKNGQAVTLYYKTWPNADIVPVFQTTYEEKIIHYNVPDMNAGEWIESKPKTHTRNVILRTEVCGEGFREVIRMAKWWNQQHSGFLQSYHIEVLALMALDAYIDDYPWYVFQFFSKACELVKLPLSYEGTIADTYLTSTGRKEALKRLETARDKSRYAWHLTYDKNNDHEGAISNWRQLFGNTFPAYGY